MYNIKAELSLITKNLHCAYKMRSYSIAILFDFNHHCNVELVICVLIMHLFEDVDGCHRNEFI